MKQHLETFNDWYLILINTKTDLQTRMMLDSILILSQHMLHGTDHVQQPMNWFERHRNGPWNYFQTVLPSLGMILASQAKDD